ncbi:MAG: bifunctional diaminohydroxyphosphoribosylaminopyrimidine deaminase/5-amino-6-(5-phosphoribosylamino)uracil reductase RibD [Phycisphaerae bacterium]
MTSAADDRAMMLRALRLAQRGAGRVEPNPMVGAVLVRFGRVVGEGYHARFGGPHAEVAALRDAGRAARGATCYVTLEPCCHFGKTPPCTDALVRAGVARMVAALRDPFPRVAGGGFRRLRAAGIAVAVGPCAAEAAELNAPYLKRLQTGRPWVIAKWAQSLDGKIATRSGDSRWISSLASRRAAHALRGRVDAVLVGVNTVMTDDPELTCRHVRPKRVAARIVADADARTPPRSRLVRTARRIPTLIATAAPRSRRAAALAAAGCEILAVPRGPAGGVHLPTLLDLLGQKQMTNLLVEGGGRLLGSFLDAGLADEAVVFVAPRLIGGRTAPGALGGVGPADVARLPPMRVIAERRLGVDRLVRLRLERQRGT